MTLIAGGRHFYKMSGSGNDFVFFDARDTLPRRFETPEAIRYLCARGTGVGGDGVVFLLGHPEANVALRYYNADGSLASLCGNATLCAASLAVALGAADPAGFSIATDAGIVRARIRDGLPEFDFPVVTDAQPEFQAIPTVAGERRLGYATTGVPHVVVQVDDLDAVDVVGRGRPVRHDPSLPHGANVNFVAHDPARGWAIRTYERGVEEETLACGTGNVATAVLLKRWGELEESRAVDLLTRSGRTLQVTLAGDDAAGWRPSLRGEGRLVFVGEVAI